MSHEDHIAQLTEEDVQMLCTGRSFERGEALYLQGAISDALRRGTALRARCQGSMLEPYRVSAELDELGVAWAACSCPYDRGGRCKHIVALLLTWIHRPQEFSAVPKTEDPTGEWDE